MLWSQQQDDALKAVDTWLRNPGKQRIFRLFGFAGTGKTTLAKHFAENVDGDVFFGAYTGKASHVLRQKGCPNASTIHSMIYNTRDKSRLRMKELELAVSDLRAAGRSDTPQGRELERELILERQRLSQPAFSLDPSATIRKAALIVIDECSMVDGRMGEDLLSFGVPILVLGDPAQLPPVAGGGFFTDFEPDIMLTDIHRQAKDSPIIAMATIVREGGRLNLGDYGESKVMLRSDITAEMTMEADQILVGKNKTRFASNRRVRQILGRPYDRPVPGDKLVCLRNDHDIGLLNGALWEIDGIGDLGSERVHLDLRSWDDDDVVLDGVEAHMHYFLDNDKPLDWFERKNAQEFDYGYALTVHKSQGSQFDNVFLFDEAGSFREHASRWLYTGITRAAEKLTIVRM